MDSTPARRAAAYRPEIEGLRGLAVLLVVLFHAGIAGFGGGFVGVDLFFVLSGFLITGLLVRERQSAGRIRLGHFYARRVRRLVPAASVVLVATLVAAWGFLDPLTRVDVLQDGAASALSVGNIRLALIAGDYFSPVGAPSPFLQFWSLGVEEQFYLVWPLLLIAAFRLSRPRVAAGVLLAAVFALSFGANVVATDQLPSWAFYSLPTRAWELALGGLLAMTWPVAVRVPAVIRGVAGWAGLAAIGVAVVVLDASVPYPGRAALLPTLAAVALLLAGEARFGPATLLARAPIRFLGRISYSLYLWHWPLFALAPVALGIAAPSADDGAAGGPVTEALPFVARLGLIALSIGLAAATCLLIEEPFRFGIRRVRRTDAQPARPKRTVLAGVAALLAIAIVGVSVASAAERQVGGLTASDDPSGLVSQPLEPSIAPDETLEPDDADVVLPSVDPSTGPAAPPPASTARPAPSVVTVPAGKPSDAGPSLPPGVQPLLADAANDKESLMADHCYAYEQATAAPDCAYGPSNAAFTVALVGDSHAGHWFPALLAVATAHHWRLVPFVKVSCPFIDVPVISRFFKREYTECEAFREATIARLAVLKPDLTIVAESQWVFPVDDANRKVATIGASLARTIERVPGRVALLVDTPHSAVDVPTCLAAHPTDIPACSTRRAQAFWGVGAIEKVAAGIASVPRIDLGSHLCASDPCPAIVNGMIVYRDSHHMTATFSRSLAPALDAALRRLLAA